MKTAGSRRDRRRQIRAGQQGTRTRIAQCLRLATAILALSTPPAALAAGAPAVTILAGHRYRFDPSVFEGGVVETGRVGSVLLELAWPEMRGLTQAEATAWPRRDTIRILANSGAAVAGSAIPDSKLEESLPQLLAAALWSTITPSGTPEPVRRDPSPHFARSAAEPGPGMARVVSYSSPSGTRDDVYVLEPIDRIKEFVACGRKDAMRIDPACAQVFVSDDLVFRVSYRRQLVVSWRTLHERVIGFFRNAEVRP